MGTTNILDLNNRLEKVEKENVAQNSYTSLKNKPKINNVTLTGNKTLADIGAAAAADLGELTDLTTTDKSSCVAAINELNSGLIGVTPIKIDGRTPANQGFAGFNTSGLDLTNRYPVAFFIVSSTEQTPYMVAQGSPEGISVGFDPITHNPNLYVKDTSDADWKDADCFVIYA